MSFVSASSERARIFNFPSNHKMCRLTSPERIFSSRKSKMTFPSSSAIKSNCVGKAFSLNILCGMCRSGLSPLRLAAKINKCQSSCHLLHRHVNCMPCSIFRDIFLGCDATKLPNIPFGRFTDYIDRCTYCANVPHWRTRANSKIYIYINLNT